MFIFLLVSTSLEERRRAEQKGKHFKFAHSRLKDLFLLVHQWLTFLFLSSGLSSEATPKRTPVMFRT
jgi:hypothetical protein